MALLFAASSSWAPSLAMWPIYCAASILFILVLTKLKPDTVISAFLLSFGISYVLYFVASSVVGLAFMPFTSSGYQAGTVIDYDTPIYLLSYSLASALQLLMSYLLFRIRRFRNGFPFLLERFAVIIALIAAGVVLIFTTWGKSFTETDDVSAAPVLFSGILIIGFGIFIWIRRGITAAYLRWAKENNIELYKRSIAEKDAEIQRLAELCETLRSGHHSVMHRLAALERGYVIMLENSHGGIAAEIASELAVSLEDVRRAMGDYERDIGRNKRAKPLPDTKIKMLNDLFGLFAERCMARGVGFDLIVNGSIPYMAENVIGQSELETMIGDHLQDALAAVGAAGDPFRSILVTLGLTGDHYEFSVSDSGVPFDVDTLSRLGAERVTTHAGAGGGGEGFMKTFETMRKCRASLIISEKVLDGAGHSKSVTVRFDGKNRYIIETHRPEAFPPSDRYIIISHMRI